MSLQRRLVTVVLVLLPVVVAGGAEVALRSAERGDAGGVALRGSRDDQVVQYLRAQRSAQHVPGMELAIVRNGRITTRWAAGDARPGTRLTPATPVQLASVSKALTGIAVMQLVGTGALELEKPVVTYLPWFTTADHAASAAITVGELLHHASGLDDDAIDTSGLLDDRSPAALERGVRAMADSNLAFAPGHGFLYANANYDLLGLLVQVRSGRRFADYMLDRVFRPMGMATAEADLAQVEKGRAAHGYYRWFGVAYSARTGPHSAAHLPSASIYASAEDMAHELLMNLGQGTVEGKEVLSPRLVEQLQRSGADVDRFSGYAAGWYVRPLWESADQSTYKGRVVTLPLVYEHSGSDSTTTTFVGFVPSMRVGVVVLMNSHDSYASSRLYALQSEVWKILLGQPPTRIPDADEDFLMHQGSVIGLTLVALLMAMLVATGREVAARRRTGAARRWTVLLLALLVEGAVMYFVWAYVPQQVHASVPTITRTSPDIAICIVAATSTVVLWAPVRTYLLARQDTTTVGSENVETTEVAEAKGPVRRPEAGRS